MKSCKISAANINKIKKTATFFEKKSEFLAVFWRFFDRWIVKTGSSGSFNSGDGGDCYASP